MKEVKLVNLDDFGGAYWSSDPRTFRSDQVKEAQSARAGRAAVEKGLADLLNEGWQMEGVGGEYLRNCFVVLVRER
jgi:hypothetical protein